MVYIAKYIPNGKNVAIKLIDLDLFERNQIDELRVNWIFFSFLKIHISITQRYFVFQKFYYQPLQYLFFDLLKF